MNSSSGLLAAAVCEAPDFLRVEDIAFAFRTSAVPTISSVNISAKRGEIHSVVGPSGSGKTTILKLIAGFLSPAKGRITLGSRDITREPPWKRGVQLVFQDLKLFDHMTVLGNVEFGVKNTDQRTRREALDLLERFSLSEFGSRNVRTLSQGQRQRVAIARALMVKPDLLLLDEPTAALDAVLKYDVIRLIQSLNAEVGMSIVMVTHDLELIFRVTAQATLLEGGHVVDSGRPLRLYHHPKSLRAAALVGELNVIPVKDIDLAWIDCASILNKVDGQVHTIAVRPEAVSFSLKEGEGTPLKLESQTEVFGSLVQVASVNSLRIYSRLPMSAASTLRVGDLVSARIAAEGAYCFNQRGDSLEAGVLK